LIPLEERRREKEKEARRRTLTRYKKSSMVQLEDSEGKEEGEGRKNPHLALRWG